MGGSFRRAAQESRIQQIALENTDGVFSTQEVNDIPGAVKGEEVTKTADANRV